MFNSGGGDLMNYVRNAWYVGAWGSDLEQNKLKAIRILAEPIVLWRTQRQLAALDDPEWILGHGQLDYQAEARYINDNLLDFSHLTYVHANSFAPVGRGADELTDGWSAYDFLIPGVLLMWSGSFKLRTAAECNYERPDYSQALRGVTFTSQAVTPTGDRTARYFFSWGPHRQHGDEALRDVLMKIAAQAFGEDKIMIEAQQRVIDQTVDPVIMPTAGMNVS